MMQTKKRPLIILTGPTAAGKTSLSLRLAEEVGGEIISADSMQIYKKMNIGTAKIMPEEMRGIPHFLVDELDPGEPFNVVRFQEMAGRAAEGIYDRGHIPLLVGGTGFYIQAFLYGVEFSEHDAAEAYRRTLMKLREEKGAAYLYDLLRERDPEYAASLHANNTKKVIRALEYFHETGEKLSVHNKKQREKSSPFSFVYFVLWENRETLYARIDRRVDAMMEAGLLQEVKDLIKAGYDRTLPSMQGIGYKEFFPYFDGEIALEEAVEQVKRDTRHFAKRQMTWFRRERDVVWIDREAYADEDAILKEMLRVVKEK